MTAEPDRFWAEPDQVRAGVPLLERTELS
ncbi:predicted protein [Streptomyces iranensis]|uniref:Uncharacterized protein n=1 Tax=Streptomyces iranensis TaxID=576784 RepID=A0A060ZQT3_9ACTN|nr:predicted protein [Streptomyces iranensis]